MQLQSTPYQNPFYLLIGAKKAITIICMAIIITTAGIDVQADAQVPVGWSTSFNLIYSQDFEGSTSDITPGFGDISHVTTNDAIDGNISIIIKGESIGFQAPEERLFLPNRIFSAKFDYRILKNKAGEGAFGIIFAAKYFSTKPDEYTMSGNRIYEPAQSAGVFSTGSLLGDLSDAGSAIINVDQGVELIVDNFKVYRSDPFEISEQPDNWKYLKFTPFPRLGNYWEREPNPYVYPPPGCKDGQNYQYTVNENEEKLAFSDVVAGFKCTGEDPDFSRRMKKKNPDIILLSYEYAWDPGAIAAPWWEELTIDMHEELLSGVADAWIARDSSGNHILSPSGSGFMMNISDYCPKVNGLTWNDYNRSFIVNRVLKLGIWDGIFLDNLYGHIHPALPIDYDPSLLDFDLNLNGVRDETPAFISDETRNAAIQLLDGLRDVFGDLEIIMGNTGASPEIAIAPYVNGYVFECWSDAWYYDSERISEGGWRSALDGYFQMVSKAVSPKIIIVEGCGNRIDGENKTLNGCGLTVEDFQAHRFMMGTTLLGDGFYEYDLLGYWSVPHWFDEYTVNDKGVAVEDRQFKGYLGQPLSDAVELKPPATIIWEEDFESGIFPDEMAGDTGAYVTKEQNDVISGEASLIIYEPDHTKVSYTGISTLSDKIIFEHGKTYLVEFDWSILETIDGNVLVAMNGLDYGPSMTLPGVVAGDDGKVHFPITIDSGDQISFGISLNGGGGKVAIDNIRVSEGGVGPWRRDFENGFVLVNPLNKPYSFTSTELSGTLNRSQIKRILGTQDPIINSGQAVTESLTLQPFDAIILLAGIKQLPVSFTISPESCIFSQSEIGASSSKAIAITNTSEKAIQLLTKLENSSDSKHFSIANDTCRGSSIDPLNTCTVQIMFSPTSTGIKSAIFTARTDVIGTPALKTDISGEAISPTGSGGGGCFIETLRY